MVLCACSARVIRGGVTVAQGAISHSENECRNTVTGDVLHPRVPAGAIYQPPPDYLFADDAMTRALADAIARVEALEQRWLGSLQRLDAAIADLRGVADTARSAPPAAKRGGYWEPR